ncbi:MAG TPA: precorrin-6y C5,15-methyltransferase (decarboxylating) subunit CbiE [Nakamurella sp.]|jgi:precorrin-6Y C5,15-methyltransferase (decarboxylating)
MIDAPIDVVGIGADGWAGLSPRARAAIGGARTVVGSPRQLALLPDAPGQERVPLPSPLRDGLCRLLAAVGDGPVGVLASGDPLVFGIGGTLIDLLGSDRVRVHPAVSSVSLAAAELGWASDAFDVVRVTGDPASLRRVLTAGRRVLVLSADETTPDAVADLLVRAGFGGSTLTVLSDLGSLAQTRLDTDAAAFAAAPLLVARLNVVALTLVGRTGWSAVGGLPDEAFEHDGQLTKRDARASALARLAPVPGQLLWDVGAGAGSVAIEWARADPRCRSVAIERDPARAARIARNASALGVPGLRVVNGVAPAALAGLPEPDAVFVGGGATVHGVIDTCWEALMIGGRLVVHGVTVETERLLIDRHARLGGELIRLSVERVEPLGSFRGWAPARPIVQWSVMKGSTG